MNSTEKRIIIMRIGIYIGSFNPPHLGHKKVIDYLIENNYVDKILIEPTPNYWDKTDLANINDRINMLKFYENEKVQVDTIHNNYPYTYELLNSVQKDYPNDTLYLILGSDNLEKLHKWNNIDELLKYAVIVLKRKSIKKNAYIDDSKFTYIDDFDFIDISSTEIRNGSDDYLDENIKQYIKKNNLYQED